MRRVIASALQGFVCYRWVLITLAIFGLTASAEAKSVDDVLRANTGVVYSSATKKFYKYFSARTKWPDAQRKAPEAELEGIPGRLAEIGSSAENSFVRNFARSRGERDSIWLGGSDLLEEGRWLWMTSRIHFTQGNRPVSGVYTNWNSGEPQNGGAGTSNSWGDKDGEDYTRMRIDNGRWTDRSTIQRFGYVIEWDADEVTGAAKTYYVRLRGNDRNSGTSPQTAFQTIAKAASVARAGSTIYVGGGTYGHELVRFNSGTALSPIKFIADLEGKFTSDGGAVVVRNRVVLNRYNNLEFVGFQFTGGYIDIDQSNGLLFSRCELFSNKHGIELKSGGATIERCVIRDNTDDGIKVSQGQATVTNCLLVKNGDNGIELKSRDGRVTVLHCTVAYNGDDGVDMDGGRNWRVGNTIIAFNGDNGLDGANQSAHGNNLVFGNRNGDYTGGVRKQSTDINRDPKFANTKDFKLLLDSPAIDAGKEIGIAVDILGAERPLGRGFDIGCYEGGVDGGSGGDDKDEYFVRRSGNDRNDGRTPRTAFRTIRQSAKVARAGSTVYVGAGTFVDVVHAKNDGTSQAPIRFVADAKGQKTGDAGKVHIGGTWYVSGADHVQIEGFEFGNSQNNGVEWQSSRNGLLKNCRIGSRAYQTYRVRGLRAYASSLTVESCIFDENNGGIRVESATTIRVAGSQFTKNKFYGMSLQGGCVAIVEDSVFANNGDSGFWSDYDRRGRTPNKLTVRRCTINNNAYGGRIYNTTGVFDTCLIRNNSRDGIMLSGTAPNFEHCTIVGNRGSGIEGRSSAYSIYNSIVANNSRYGIRGSRNVRHSHNLSHGNRGGNFVGFSPARSELSVNPRFVSSSDFHLADGSPAINKANSSASAGPDIEGNKRPVGAAPDLGCYENGTGGDDDDDDDKGPNLYVRRSGSDRNSGRTPKKAFRTIGKALAVVKPGETVFVGSGSYKEQLSRVQLLGTTKKPVRFVADVKGKETGDAGAVTTTSVYLQNSSQITWEGFAFQGSGSIAVRSVNSSNLSLVRCSFSARSVDALIDRGNASFANCSFGTSSIGVRATPSTNVVVKDSSFNNASTGVIADRATLNISKASFARSTSVAVQTTNSNVSMTEVKATQGRVGFNLTGGTANISKCSLRGMSTAGVYLQRARGTVSDTTVQDSGSGFYLTGAQQRGDIKARELKLRNIAGTGLHLERVEGDIEGAGTRIAGNQSNGIYMQDCRVTLSNGTIQRAAIGVNLSNSDVTFEKLTLLDSRSTGIVASNSTANISGVTINRVANGSGTGMSFSNRSKPTVAGCKISGCGTAIQLSSNHTATLANCTLTDVGTGLNADQGKVALTDSTITNTSNYAVSINNGSNVTLRNVSMNKGRNGVRMTRCTSVVENVTITEMTRGSWAFSQQGTGTIAGLTIDGSQSGLHLAAYNKANAFEISNVKLKNIAAAGMNLSYVNGSISSEGKQLAGSSPVGVTLANCGLTISDATISRATVGVSTNGGNVKLVNVSIQDASSYGLQSNGTDLAMQGCAFGNNGTGIYGTSGTLEASDTMFDDSSRFGLQLTNNSSVKLTNVSIRNGGAGASITNSTSAIDNVSVIGSSSNSWAFHQSGKGSIKNLTVKDSKTGLSLSGSDSLGAFTVSNVRVKNIAGAGLKLTRVDGAITADNTQLAGAGSYGVELTQCRVTLGNAKIANATTGIYANQSLLKLAGVSVKGSRSAGLYASSTTASVSGLHVSNIRGGYGMLFNASQPSLADCSVNGGSIGIYSYGGSNTTIEQSQLTGASYGLYAYDSSVNVANSTVNNTKSIGLYAYRSPKVKLSNVTVTSGRRGVYGYRTASEIDNLTVSDMSSWAVQQQGSGSLSNTTVRDSSYGIALAGAKNLGDFKVTNLKVRDIAKQGLSFTRVDGDITGEGAQIAGGGSYGVYFNLSRASLTNGSIRNGTYGVYTRDSELSLNNLDVSNSRAYGVYTYRTKLAVRKSVLAGTRSWAIVQSSGNMTLANSVVADNGYGIYSYSPTNSMIVNATIVNNRYGIYKYGGHLDVYNNIISTTGGYYGLMNRSGTMTHTHNLVSGFYNLFYNTAMHDSETTTEPKFRDPSNGQYQHRKGSAAINAGRDVSQWVSTDTDGVARPQNKVYDLGAHEFVGVDGGFRILKWTESK